MPRIALAVFAPLSAAALALSLLSPVAWAQSVVDKPPSEEATEAPPASPLSFNAGLVTDYRYRGISQSRLAPALQGGVDYAAANGLYVGAWATNIGWIRDAGGNGRVEVDAYGGYKGKLAKDTVNYDLGGLLYWYPNNALSTNANTFEVYGTVGWKVFTLKYSHALTNLFGYANSAGSGYLDLSAVFDLGKGWSLTPHVGHQAVRHNASASYTDYALTLGKDLGNNWSASAALLGTDANAQVYITNFGRFTGRTAVVLGIKKTF